MTTIIASKKAMIADMQVTRGNTKQKTIPKILRVGNSLIGMAGNLDAILAVRQWFENGQQGEFPKDENISGVIVNKEGIWEFFGNGIPYKYPGKYLALGTGSDFALGALEAGADMATALKIAKKLDTHSGFGTTYMELE
jgi:ATP-dependent protease HslVU (ClpYQ) peptidase subunit